MTAWTQDACLRKFAQRKFITTPQLPSMTDASTIGHIKSHHKRESSQHTNWNNAIPCTALTEHLPCTIGLWTSKSHHKLAMTICKTKMIKSFRQRQSTTSRRLLTKRTDAKPTKNTAIAINSSVITAETERNERAIAKTPMPLTARDLLNDYCTLLIAPWPYQIHNLRHMLLQALLIYHMTCQPLCN